MSNFLGIRPTVRMVSREGYGDANLGLPIQGQTKLQACVTDLLTQSPGLFSGKENIYKHLSQSIWFCMPSSNVMSSLQDPGIRNKGQVPVCLELCPWSSADGHREASSLLKGVAATLGRMMRTELQGRKPEEPLGKCRAEGTQT